jgi:hypothetical protein
MRPSSVRVLIVGGFIIGMAIVSLLAFSTYSILSEDDGAPGAQVAQHAQTATPRPLVTRTPLATPTPTPPPPTPSPALEPTSEPTEEPPPSPPPTEEPPPPPMEESPPPPTEEPPPPAPVEEPPPIDEPPPPLTEEPSPPPTQGPPSSPESTYAAACQAWIDAGQSPDDLEGASACISFLSEVCLAYLSDPSVVGGAEACQALDILLAYYPQPPRVTEGEIVVETCIDGEFTGWSGDTAFELCNGQVWIQASYAYLYHYAYRPAVTIVSTNQGYRFFVEGVSDSILVARVTDFIRTCIDGDFEGWEGETIFVLCNGQVWQQASYDYTYHYAYRPDVLIYQTGSGYRMKVEGVQKSIRVIRLQ